jgi:hypothetical protein
MEQASPTTKTIAEAKMLTDYLHTYPHVVIRYYASNIRLQIASDPAYLVLLKAKRRAAVHYHLGWRNSYRTHGAVDVLCQTIKIVVSSSPEAEMGDPSTWAGNMPAPYMQPLKNLAINSHPPDPLSKPTTAPPKASSIPKCTKKSSQVFQHALLVDERQNQARPIQSHLGPWQTLLDKHENSDKANPRNREPRCIYTIEYWIRLNMQLVRVAHFSFLSHVERQLCLVDRGYAIVTKQQWGDCTNTFRSTNSTLRIISPSTTHPGTTVEGNGIHAMQISNQDTAVLLHYP